jgi:hypothetical protein
MKESNFLVGPSYLIHEKSFCLYMFLIWLNRKLIELYSSFMLDMKNTYRDFIKKKTNFLFFLNVYVQIRRKQGKKGKTINFLYSHP